MRVLVATTANDGHFGPLLPFARACADAGHEVAVAAPESYAVAVRRAGFEHRPFGDAPPELIGPHHGDAAHAGVRRGRRRGAPRGVRPGGRPGRVARGDGGRRRVATRCRAPRVGGAVVPGGRRAGRRADRARQHRHARGRDPVRRGCRRAPGRARRHRRARGRPRDRRPGGRAGVQLGPRVARPRGGRGPARGGGLRPVPRARPRRGRRPPARLGRPGPATRLRDVRLGHRVARPLRRPLP